MKAKILQEATKLYAEKSVQFSMNDLAMTCGIKAPSLYNYYSSKDELINDVIINEIDRYYEYIQNLEFDKDTPSEMQLKILFYSIINYFSDIQCAMLWRRIGIGDGLYQEEIQNRIFRGDSGLIANLRSFIENCVQTEIINIDSVEGAIIHFHMIIQGLITQSIYSDKVSTSFDRMVDLTWDSFWFGFTNRH